MGWKVYGDSYNSDSELGTKYSKFKFNDNTILRYVRTWIIFFNDPNVTSLKMEIYGDRDGEMGSLLYTSNSLTKAQMITLENGIKEVPFSFDDIQLDGNNYYYFVLNGVVSGMSGASHIAWKKGWPDPIYQTGLNVSFEELHSGPYDIYFIGSKL